MSPFAALPQRHYRAIAIDPPWAFSGGMKGRPQHYGRMSDREIADLPVADLAHPDGCFLFLWTTSPKAYRPPGSAIRLDPAEIARAWGFRWSSRAFVWVKTGRGEQDGMFVYRDGLSTGHGFTTRKGAEDVLLFRRGRPKRLDAGVHEVIHAPVREHSRKPDEFYRRVERFCPGPRLEIFARESRPGWDTFGNEATKFDPAPAAPALMAAE